jgi:twitching motility protein PilT
MLQHVNETFSKHIITIEDPIEYEFQDSKSFFEQREVGIDTESFSSALKYALRQDPDIIMVGEMRDKSSFDAALQAADTGHLVISTMHAANSSQAIVRILDFYPQEEQEGLRRSLSTNLKSIISQRLLPKVGGGVVPACEVMVNTPLIRNLLEEDKLDKISRAVEGGGEDGMVTFDQCLLKLFNEGKITEADAMDSATNPSQLKMNMKGIFLSSSGGITG